MMEQVITFLAHYGFQLAFLLTAPFLFLGISHKVKAFCAGSKGPSLFQPFYDTFKLLRKGAMFSTSSTLVFQMSSSVSLGAVLFAALLVPVADLGSVLDFNGNFIVFAYALGLSRFFTIISALDTASSLEGMGASREAFFSSLKEPGFFLLFGTLAAFFGKTSFTGLLTAVHTSHPLSWLFTGFTALFLFITLITESGRLSNEDPNKHFELSMVHEAMVLDNSGPDLALIHYTSNLKKVILSALLASLLLPPGLTAELSRLIFCGIIILEAILAGCIEFWTVRLRMSHVPQFLFVSSSIALVVLCILSFTVFGGSL